MKLLEKIEAIDFSDSEKSRLITALLDANSLPYLVLTSKAPTIRDSDFWHRAQRHFKITGFREGSAAAVTRIISRVLANLRTQAPKGLGSAWPQTWPLYSRCVHLYLHEKHHALESLLKQEEFQPSPGTDTEQILRCIMKCAPLHDAEPGDVRALYELWGFERSQFAEEILSAVTVDISAMRRLVDSGVSTMRRELAIVASTASSELIRRAETQISEIESLRRDVGRLKQQLGEQIHELDAKYKAAEIAPKAAVSRKDQRRHDDKSGVPGSRRAEDVVTAALRPIMSRLDSLSGQIKANRDRIELLERPVRETSRPGINRALSTTTPRKLLDDWQNIAQGDGIAMASLGTRWLLLTMLRRARILISELPSTLVSLFKALPGAEVRHAVASPLWVDSADWKEHLEFLTPEADSPRLLVLTDFDIAIQETYLIPPMLAWSEGCPPNSNRLLLVPSGSDAGATIPRVYEASVVLPSSLEYARELSRIGDSIVDLPPTLDVVQSTAEILSFSHSRNSASEDQLRQYANNYGVALPRRVVENFTNLYDGFRASVSARDAGYLTLQAALDPWLDCARGATVAATLQAALRSVLDNG